MEEENVSYLIFPNFFIIKPFILDIIQERIEPFRTPTRISYPIQFIK